MCIPTVRARAALALAVAALVCAAAPAGASTGKPVQAKLTPADERNAIDVKFAEGSDVRLRGGRLVTAGKDPIPALEGVSGLRISRLLSSFSEEQLEAEARAAEKRSGHELKDPNLYFRIHTRGAAETLVVLDRLDAVDAVEFADPVAKPAPPPATPSFVSRQGYRTAVSGGGIDADFAQAITGGKGEKVTVVDVEYAWNRSHEDLSKLLGPESALKNGTPCGNSNTDHGTAVLGELVGDPNGFGVSGLVPGATIRTVNALATTAADTCDRNLPNAIAVAAANTAPGDVILLEQQSYGPNSTVDPDSQLGMVPVEFDRAVRDQIASAVKSGRVVVEAAGNGSQNLDDPIYQGYFATDSGAIMVGAGNAPGCDQSTVTRGRLSFSNHGGTLDLQGWGNCVSTTGYGDLQGTSGGTTAYTATFGGTSSASPIVAAAAGVVSSVAEARGGSLKPAQIRDLLRSTGQPQQLGSAGNIGPLPNLRAAIAQVAPSLKESGHVIGGNSLTGATVPVRQSWSSSGSAAVSHDVFLRTDGGAWVKQTSTSATATFDLERGHSYQFAARAADVNGVWSDWAYGAEFRVDAYQENYVAGNPAFGGTWTRTAWTPASDGFLSVSSAPGARATFSFTGSSVAWIGTKATNRGQARVYMDGVLAKTVDLYSSTTAPQAIAHSHSWPESGAHTIAVEVVGTAGRPSVDVDAFVRLR